MNRPNPIDVKALITAVRVSLWIVQSARKITDERLLPISSIEIDSLPPWITVPAFLPPVGHDDLSFDKFVTDVQDLYSRFGPTVHNQIIALSLLIQANAVLPQPNKEVITLSQLSSFALSTMILFDTIS